MSAQVFIECMDSLKGLLLSAKDEIERLRKELKEATDYRDAEQRRCISALLERNDLIRDNAILHERIASLEKLGAFDSAISLQEGYDLGASSKVDSEVLQMENERLSELLLENKICPKCGRSTKFSEDSDCAFYGCGATGEGGEAK